MFGKPWSEHLIGIDPDRESPAALRGGDNLIVQERRGEHCGKYRGAKARDQKRRAPLWLKAREQN